MEAWADRFLFLLKIDMSNQLIIKVVHVEQQQHYTSQVTFGLDVMSENWPQGYKLCSGNNCVTYV